MLYPIVSQMIKNFGITSKQSFKKYFSKSETLMDVDFWTDDGIKEIGYAGKNVRSKVLKEMGLGIPTD